MKHNAAWCLFGNRYLDQKIPNRHTTAALQEIKQKVLLRHHVYENKFLERQYMCANIHG